MSKKNWENMSFFFVVVGTLHILYRPYRLS